MTHSRYMAARERRSRGQERVRRDAKGRRAPTALGLQPLGLQLRGRALTMSGPPARLRSRFLSAIVGPPRGASAWVPATPLPDLASIRAAPVKGVGATDCGRGQEAGEFVQLLIRSDFVVCDTRKPC